MRPDEHKKRKNTQYKKKHGMSDKENKNESKPKGTDQDKKEKSSQAKSTEGKKKVIDSKPSKGAQGETTEEDSKQYRRRNLVSNWSRYEDSSASDDDDDVPVQRGEDFNKLLAEAGGSAAQFRFKDEEEWSGDHQGTTTPLLALDFENLSESLSCIPLHERLGIAEHLFTEEQKNEMKTNAAEMESKYRVISGEGLGNTRLNKNPNTVGLRMKGSVKSEEKGKHSLKDDLKKSELSAIQSLNKTVASDGPAQSSGVISNENKPVSNTKTKVVEREIKSKGTVNKTEKSPEVESKVKSKEVESLEDDLDMILSLDESNNQKTETVNDVRRQTKSDVTVNKEMNAINMKAEEKTKENGSDVKGNGNLEDWLDSMLDD